MSDFNTNLFSRTPIVKAENIIQVFDENDLPAPSGGVRTLTDTVYLFSGVLTTSDTLLIDNPGVIVLLQADFAFGSTFIYNGSNSLFQITPGTLPIFTNITVLLTAANAIAFDIDGAPGSAFRQLFVSGSDSQAGQIAYLIKNSDGIEMGNILYRRTERGLVFEDCSGIFVTIASQRSVSPIADYKFIELVGQNTSFRITSASGNRIEAGQTLLEIDPLTIGPVIITFCGSELEGDFFGLNGSTGIITAFADASVASTTINSVQDNGGNAEFLFTVGPTLFVGQEVVISGFVTNTAYNGTFIITAVAAGQFTVAVAFGTDEAGGSFVSDSVTVTDAAHGLTELTHIAITNSINYNGGFEIYAVDVNDFRINATFVAETPFPTTQWSSNSLDETDPRVTVENSPPQKDSMTIGSILASGNAAETVIALANTPVDLNLDGLAVASASNERFTLTDTTTGEIRYDGNSPVSVALGGLVSAIAGGGGQVYNFIMLQNGSPLTSPDDVDVPVDLGADAIAFPLEWSVTASPGDLFRLQVENTVNTQNLTIETIKYVIK